MQAPAEVPPARLKELHIRLDLPPKRGQYPAPVAADAAQQRAVARGAAA